MSMDEKVMPPVSAAKETVKTVEDLVPKSWRAVVDAMLGSDFRLSLSDSSGGNYVLKIHVPPKYDCRVGDERAMSKEDIRSCLIRRSSDISDLQTWCLAIKANISKKYPDFK